MSFNRDDTQVLGWAYESTAETDPISTTSSLYWKFGIDAAQYSLPIEEHQKVPLYDGSSRDPVKLKIIKAQVYKSIGFWPVNAIPFYMFLGSASSSAGVHTITGKNTGAKKTFTVRAESRGGDSDTFMSAVGCKVQNMSMGFDNTLQNMPLSMGVAYQGIKQITPTLNSTHTTGTKYPTDDYLMTGTENDDKYIYDSNFTFTWDYGGSAENYKSALLSFNYIGSEMFNVSQLSNQSEIEFIDEGLRQHIVKFTIIRGKDSALHTDFLADTQHDILFKIYNTSTNYLQVVFDDCLGSLHESKYVNTIKEEIPTWEFVGMAESITVTAKDGCSTSFYGL